MTAYTPLTPEQYQAARLAGFSPEKIIENEKFRKSDMESQASTTDASNTVPGTVIDAVKGTASDYANAPKNFIAEAGRNDSSTSKNPIIRTAENSLGATASGINTVFSPITHLIKGASDYLANSGLGHVIENNPVMGKILDLFGGAQNKLGEWSDQHPEAARNLNNLLTVGLSATGEKPATEALKTTGDAVKTGATKTAGLLTDAKTAIQEKATNMALNSEKKGWSKPTNVPKASYNKATEIYKSALDRGQDISDTLTKNNIRLSDHVETNASGNKIFNTADAAEKMHSDAAKLSKEMLRPALEQADASGVVPRTPVSDLIKDSIANIKKSDMTLEAQDKMIENLTASRASLEKQFPNGMSLTDLHDEKINRDLNAKYSPVGDPAVNMEATKNKAIADAARKMVEDKAPEGIPVKEFNAELAKQHKAANYLEALHTKPVPKTILGNIAKTAAKVVGAGVGSGLGGGVLGGVGGYHIGGMVESLIEGVPNPVKSLLLKNLEVTNPEAFKQIQSYLNSRETNPSVAQPSNIASKSVTISDSNTIPKDKGQEMEMGSYKLRKNPTTGLVELSGQYRKPGINFYSKESKTNLGKKVTESGKPAKKTSFGRKK